MNSAERLLLYGNEEREPDLRRTDAPRHFDIKQMWQRTHEIIGMVAAGMKHVDVARVLDITPATVSNAVNSELGQKRLAELREKRNSKFADISERIAELTRKALDIYDTVLDASDNPASLEFNPNVTLEKQIKVADTVMLELSGHRAAQKSMNLHATATVAELDEFKKRGREEAAKLGHVIDVTPKEGE